MKQTLRPTGVDVIGNIPWGTHFCHFYQTKEDLLSVQVPFFKTGLENNEYCIWITSEQTSIEDAIIALKDVPGIDKYFERGSIEILTRPDWFMSNGRFILDQAIQFIYDRLNMAVEYGYAGLRVNGDDTWRDQKLWQDFMEFERALTPAIAGKKLIVSCSWQLTKCSATDVLDVALLHESTISKRKGAWEILETPELVETKAQLNLEKELLEKQVAKSTRELYRITGQVKKERSERKKAMLSLRKSQLHLKTIVDTADIAFTLFDSDSHILLFNPIASYWSTLSFGVPLKKDIYFPDLLNEAGKSHFNEMMKAALSGQSLNYETSYQDHQRDSPEWYRVSINPVMDDDGQVVGVSCAASNITVDKLVESERERLSGQLAQRNKDLDKFALILSHDLRAPLANMLALATMLKDTNVSESEKSELEGFLFYSMEKLNDVVHNLNRILDLDKVRSLKKEKIDLTELVNEVSAQFKPVIKQNTIRIVTDFNRANNINSVRDYLYNIFYNLISNWIIYRQQRKPPFIEIMSKKEKDKLIIYFKSFGKANYRKGNKTEAGPYKKINVSGKSNDIPLYGVKSKIGILGGSISVRTLPGSGIEYRMELPFE